MIQSMELIDRHDVLTHSYEYYSHVSHRYERVVNVRDIIHTPEKIVRCKDCIHAPTIPGSYEDGFSIEFPDEMCPCQCPDGWYNRMPPPEWFCANGERKV